MDQLQLEAPQPTPASEPLAALILESGVPDLGEWAADYFLGDQFWNRTHRTLHQLAWDISGAERVVGQIVLAVEALVASLKAARARAVVSPVQPVGDEKLNAFRAALWQLRLSMASQYPLGLFTAKAKVEPQEEDLTVEVNFPGDLRPSAADRSPLGPRNRPVVTLPTLSSWAQTLRLSCSCGGAQCVHRALALDGLLHETQRNGRAGSRRIAGLLFPPWQRALRSLSNEEGLRNDEGPATLSVHLDWDHLSLTLYGTGRRGQTRYGAPLDVRRIHALQRLSGADRRIAELWFLSELNRDDDSPEGDFRHARSPGSFYGDLLLLLEGHPAVYPQHASRAAPVRVEAARVVFEETEGGLSFQVFVGAETIRYVDGYSSSRGDVVMRIHGGEVVLYLVAPEVRRLLEEMAYSETPRFPEEALPELVRHIPRLEAAAPVLLPERLRGTEEVAATRTVIRVEYDAFGASVSLMAEPLVGGPVFVPGQGVPLSAAFDGLKRRFARRQLGAEVAAAQALADQLALGPAFPPQSFHWNLFSGDQTLDQLHRIAQSGAPVEWKGTSIRFTRPVQLGALKLKVAKGQDFFNLEGEAELEDDRVTLAALLEAARERRRWVKVGAEGFAHVSDEVAARLRPLASMRQLSPAAIPLVEALRQHTQSLEVDAEWKQRTERWAQAKDLPCPVPAQLEGVLRDYQREGFVWLSRLAGWGAGAVLADDMGLGKTLQALTLLVSRQALGPALVVAPSSVLHTWKVEAARFAPELKVRFFHEGERALEGCGPGELVVVSWSLFAREAKRFARQRFATAVLDEAQAIKNAGTLRARAAHKLHADFIVALSGTPVENHLGELWSLFQAVLPGLLGTEFSFRAQFGSGDRESMQALAAVVKPFILRRTKKAVAPELPARSDLDVVVPLSAEERALYEDVRLAALAELGELTGEKRRFEVLAALTRLRLAACHPRLVDAGWKGSASKLQRLVELVNELSSAGHRVLVFSQFTQHLALVCKALQKESVRFSYLDGSTPIDERQRLVEAFQAGKGGDAFLISLKAGGTGLTLTAADYVIHLDPWWNPAVEDQASDRAHRIGQSKPVTVYRLISEGTIEEKILTLHRVKRELVDALLEGTDAVGKLSAEELVGLMQLTPPTATPSSAPCPSPQSPAGPRT